MEQRRCLLAAVETEMAEAESQLSEKQQAVSEMGVLATDLSKFVFLLLEFSPNKNKEVKIFSLQKYSSFNYQNWWVLYCDIDNNIHFFVSSFLQKTTSARKENEVVAQQISKMHR